MCKIPNLWQGCSAQSSGLWRFRSGLSAISVSASRLLRTKLHYEVLFYLIWVKEVTRTATSQTLTVANSSCIRVSPQVFYSEGKVVSNCLIWRLAVIIKLLHPRQGQGSPRQTSVCPTSHWDAYIMFSQKSKCGHMSQSGASQTAIWSPAGRDIHCAQWHERALEPGAQTQAWKTF